jgi:hypothetical protein
MTAAVPTVPKVHSGARGVLSSVSKYARGGFGCRSHSFTGGGQLQVAVSLARCLARSIP